ncbi:MAG: type II toxin-antitoxin system RelE/ParE family toxin [Alphaproteobacteria bacterium]|nr:type II toxin-antitoxin system RelE/ParE family toxin [Alphaproteobacteria bacterium]MCB9930464.1 type II toxin-antitoxin system RelE/ParE family toxin [Alphaproteobacteria bacterium]
MRVFVTKPFARFAGQEGLADRQLREVARRVVDGLVDADLGGGVIKQRIARQGQGKSGGFRSVVLYRKGDTLFFVYGFAKKARTNIRKDELQAFRLLADQMLAMDDTALKAAMANGTIAEILDED